MSKVYQCDLMRLETPSVYEHAGDIVQVDGEQMIRLPHGTIVPLREGQWHETLPAARRAAAAQVEAITVTLHGLAARLRAEADAEEARACA
jgi:hypothetical protein